MFQGILPKQDNRINYSEAKFALKKQFGYDFTVSQIDLIINFILILRLKTQEPETYLEGDEQLDTYTTSLGDDFKQQIESIIQRKLTTPQFKQLIITINDLMYIQNDRINNTASPYEQKSIYCSNDQYAATQSELSALFKRVLTKQEFHIFLESWFYYMSLAQDASDIDNRYKEQLNELKADLAIAINSTKKKISAYNRISNQIKSLERFPHHDLKTYEYSQHEEQKQLTFCEKELARLNQSNGHELNVHKLREQAYFAILFCAETLGLSAPNQRKYGNPLLTVLKVMLNINEEEKDLENIKICLSQIYQKYVRFKKSDGVRDVYEDLICKARANPDCYVTLSNINRDFRSLLLPLTLQPKISINSDPAL
ncbi:hypothetical protein [Legionella sainthelensi]|nr:hypothetical protein [Legionella sainthelensi]